MTEQTIAMKGKRGIGPFKDPVEASLYLSKLGIDDIEPVAVIEPPVMSNLLVEACAFLKENPHGTTDKFLGAIAGTPEEGVTHKRAEWVLSQARTLLEVLFPDRAKLTYVELIELLYKELGPNRTTVLKALRQERGLGLGEARDIMKEAKLW